MTDGYGESPAKCSDVRDKVSLVMAAETVTEFFPLLQMGVNIPAAVPCGLGNFLHEQLCLDREYVSERITTIFVDGKATDNLDETVVRDRSTIALSAAMPGVVGATMRRGSYYASMRSAITAEEDIYIGTCKEGLVCVKLFNLLLTDLGQEILERGIILTASGLSALILRIPDPFRRQCREVMINSQSVDPACMQNIDQLIRNTVMLSIRFI